jgi:nucleoid DNA-binding protein
MKMNKGDLINEVAKLVSSKKQAQEVVDCVFSAVTDTLKKNEPVQIAGFGSFKTAKREARTGRNPQTGAEIKIEARMVPKFVPAKALKDAVK